MSMDRDPNLYDRDNTVSGHNSTLHTNTTDLGTTGTHLHDHGHRRGSNTLAYLIGGLVLALGLLAFLFYDGNNSGDVSTTGSTSTQTERSTSAPAGGASTTAPAGGTTAPATPARP